MYLTEECIHLRIYYRLEEEKSYYRKDNWIGKNKGFFVAINCRILICRSLRDAKKEKKKKMSFSL